MSEYADIVIGNLSLHWFRNYVDSKIVSLFFSKNDLIVVNNCNIDDDDKDAGTYTKYMYRTTVRRAKERLDAQGFGLNNFEKIFNDEMPQILNNCDGIITVSEFSKLDIANEFNFPLEKIFVTPLAAEDIYRPINRSYCKNVIKDKYRINNNFILYVGGYSPRKNIIGIMEAFSLLRNTIKKDLKIVITGKKGLSYERYKNRAIELGITDSVIFTDFIPLEDLPLFYNACEFLIYPSFYEGFGLPPLEAMACGTPVIASNVTSVPEVCQNSAILVNPHDVDELSYSMERVLTDSFLKLTMIERGLSTSNKYSWKNTALNTIDAYKNIIDF